MIIAPTKMHFSISSEYTESPIKLIEKKELLLHELSKGNCLKCQTQFSHFEDALFPILEKHKLPTSIEQLENIHHIISPEEAMDILIRIRKDTELINLQTEIMMSISDQFGLPMYIEQEPNFRFHFPIEKITRSQKQIEKKIGTGQLTSHKAHKDSYFYHPRETYNLWFSITRSTPENGMFVKLFSRDLYPYTHKNRGDFRDLSWLNVYTDLQPFEGLLFPAENIHGSILNTSNTTRIAFSMRFSLVKPVPQKGRSYKYISYKVNDKDPSQNRFDPYELGQTLSGSILRTKYRSNRQLCKHQGADFGFSSLINENDLVRCPRHCLFDDQ